MLGPQIWVRLITLKNQLNIQKHFLKKWKKAIKKLFLTNLWALKIISSQFWIRFWSHSNKFLEKVFAKALFLKSFLVGNFWKMWFWFCLTDPTVEHILTCYQAYLWSSKKCRTKFWYIWRPYMCYKLEFKNIFKELKTICPFRFRYVFTFFLFRNFPISLSDF